MGFFTISPNMSLNIPTVGQEPGPQFAFDVNTSLTLIDQHDHTPGRGVQITPAGININTALSLNGNNLTNALNISFNSQSSSSVLQALYVAPGTETPPLQDLWYNDSAGNAVQLTSNGLVNATIASLPGESYAGGTFFWKQGTGSTTPANFDIGFITIRPNVALTTFGVTLTPPSAIASAYNIALPLLPSVNSFMAIDNSGNITTPVSTASFLPNNAGAQGYFYRQSSTGVPTWATLDSTQQVITSAYTVLATDDIVLSSGGSYQISLPTAVGIQGKEITLTKTDASLANRMTIKGNGSETIGSFGNTVTLASQNETWILYSDNVNWQVKAHLTASPTIVDTNVIINTGAFGTTTTKEWRFHREANFIVGQLIVVQTVAGTIGTGEYRLTVPSGLTIDTTIAPASNSVNAFIGLSLSSLPSTCTVLIDAGSLPQITGQLCVYDSTHVRMIGQYYNNGTTFITAAESWQVGTASLNNAGLSIMFSFRMPISGWLP